MWCGREVWRMWSTSPSSGRGRRFGTRTRISLCRRESVTSINLACHKRAGVRRAIKAAGADPPACLLRYFLTMRMAELPGSV
jgi:hypothetical protein